MAILKKEIIRCIDQMNSGFLITDVKGNVLYCNKAYIELTKLKDIKIGEPVEKYKQVGKIKGEPACLEVVKEGKKIIRQFTQSEDGVFIVSSSEPVFDECGEILRVITRVHDMTNFFTIRDDIENVRLIMEKLAENSDVMSNSYGENIIAFDANYKEMLDRGKKVAGFDIPVLLMGESGVGKDVAARFIHDNSHRKYAPFVAINCAAIPENLLETELFGYTKGTFTGQVKEGKAGLFEAAKGGTLFLDEIGDMPLNLQAKLLRVLESKTYMAVGSNIPIETDVRIISATNHNLKTMIDSNTFREDLYYRINVVELPIPPLRERKEDIVPLSFFFLNQFNKKYNQNKTISAPVLQQLQFFNWPGNIRQLKNVIEMMCVLSAGSMLEAPDYIQDNAKIEVSKISGCGSAETIIQEFAEQDDMNDVEELLPLDLYNDHCEKKYLEKAYQICKTTRRMAEVLNVNHSTIIRKMKKYGIGAKMQS